MASLAASSANHQHQVQSQAQGALNPAYPYNRDPLSSSGLQYLLSGPQQSQHHLLLQHQQQQQHQQLLLQQQLQQQHALATNGGAAGNVQHFQYMNFPPLSATSQTQPSAAAGLSIANTAAAALGNAVSASNGQLSASSMALLSAIQAAQQSSNGSKRPAGSPHVTATAAIVLTGPGPSQQASPAASGSAAAAELGSRKRQKSDGGVRPTAALSAGMNVSSAASVPDPAGTAHSVAALASRHAAAAALSAQLSAQQAGLNRSGMSILPLSQSRSMSENTSTAHSPHANGALLLGGAEGALASSNAIGGVLMPHHQASIGSSNASPATPNAATAALTNSPFSASAAALALSKLITGHQHWPAALSAQTLTHAGLQQQHRSASATFPLADAHAFEAAKAALLSAGAASGAIPATAVSNTAGNGATASGSPTNRTGYITTGNGMLSYAPSGYPLAARAIKPPHTQAVPAVSLRTIDDLPPGMCRSCVACQPACWEWLCPI